MAHIISYWLFPVIAAVVWFGMLLSMLLVWICSGRPHYASMESYQTIALISDVGADFLKPWFITGSVVTTIFLDLSLLSEGILRRQGRLVRNTSRWQLGSSVLAFIFAVVGTAGLILLSIFDTLHHPSLHRLFLLLFMAGYLLCAICICYQSQRLGIEFRQFRILRVSFWTKLVVIVVEICLCIAFGATLYKHAENAAAILEWSIAFIFTFFILSFLPDLLPAIHTERGDLKQVPVVHMGERGAV